VVILAEPIARNTAPALALAAGRMILDGRGEETCLVMPADHLITAREGFSLSVDSAAEEARKGFIVPFGITPESPATGYGYIETGKQEGSGFEVISFREKPDSETAEKYLSSGRYYWNSGLFTYRNDVFLRELSACTPEVADIFSSPDEKWFKTREDNGIRIYEPAEILSYLYESCPGISMDYAVMEKTDKIRMVKAGFDWNDVGSWDVIAQLDSSTGKPVYSYESEGNYVYSDRPVALCGVEDLIVVVANNRVMVCKKGMSQLVKEVAEEDLSRQ
jgi:mannose-1-phosphate guanylyltransferase/mannose-1-phosphate guanylyltransferase/mannose-6-phosphate isomerase